ncbi:MAG: hypothetical protein LBR25_01645 [Erysipelotrichaceae bacterium]|jgi:hypothetical protein|nr:hypothetical protein [Erysipelotrichaceae bacterium]
MPIIRLINANRTAIREMSASDLKKSIMASEGRVIMTQFFVWGNVMGGVNNAELQQAFGSDMVMMNGYSTDPKVKPLGLRNPKGGTYKIRDLKKIVDIPLGVYLECGDPEFLKQQETTSYGVNMLSPDRIASRENLIKIKEAGADFVVLAGNPGSGVTHENIIKNVKIAKEVLGDDILIFAGKWEDGVYVKVLGDPILGVDESKRIIKELLDAGADCITMPMPGSRTGVTVNDMRELVTFIHTYKPGSLALSFLDASIEGADEETIRKCAVLSKQTGADIHCLGDADLQGSTRPENVYSFSIAAKGRLKTWFRMAGSKH